MIIIDGSFWHAWTQFALVIVGTLSRILPVNNYLDTPNIFCPSIESVG